MGIDVEGHGQHLPDLNIKLLHAICPKDLETNLFGVLFLRFQYILSYLPLRASALTDNRTLGQNCYNSSCDIHNVYLIIYTI